MYKYLLAILIAFLFSLNSVLGAEISGDVYDLNFNKLSNVIVEINSIPKQSFIVKNSGYKFILSPGNYTIKAVFVKNKGIIASTQENILIKDPNGIYNLDLILFPNIENDDSLDINFPGLDEEPKNKNFGVLLVILSIISILVVIYLIMSFRKTFKKSQKIEENLKTIEPEVKDEALEKAYSIIKKEKRINQKDLRKQLNLSEAKVSLIISQLDSEEKVKKIKKGRGNIIIFNK